MLSNVKVDVGTPSSVNVALEVGTPTETVQVVDVAGELLQSQNATVGTTITGRQIVDQPQASRDALDLITLFPAFRQPVVLALPPSTVCRKAHSTSLSTVWTCRTI